MLKKFIFFISLFFFSNITIFLSAEIIPLKKPIQTQEEKDQKLLIDVMKPLPKPVTKILIEENKTAPIQQGHAVCFASFLRHRVKPVTQGIRKSLVVWFGGTPFK